MDYSRYLYMFSIQTQIKSQLRKIGQAKCGSLNNLTLAALERKLQGPSVRSFFVVSIYNLLEEYSMIMNIPFNKLTRNELDALAIGIEAQMADMYMLNHIIDSKFGTQDGHDKSLRAIGADILKDRIYDFYEDSFSLEKSAIINRAARKAFKEVSAGQFIDIQYDLMDLNNDESLEDFDCFRFPTNFHSLNLLIKDLTQDYRERKNSIEVYFTRAYLISSPLFREYAKILFYLTGFDDPVKKYVLAFADTFGVLAQLINDNCDFVYEKGTSNKKSCDVLSDLKNQTVTLPIILHDTIPHPPGIIDEFMQKFDKKLLNNSHNLVLKEMIRSKALLIALGVGRKIAKEVSIYLNKMTDLLPNESRVKKNLFDLVEIASFNRYYYHIFSAKKLYQKEGFGNDTLYRCEDKQNGSPSRVHS